MLVECLGARAAVHGSHSEFAVEPGKNAGGCVTAPRSEDYHYENSYCLDFVVPVVCTVLADGLIAFGFDSNRVADRVALQGGRNHRGRGVCPNPSHLIFARASAGRPKANLKASLNRAGDILLSGT
jgi:hypothetical protein